jgi:hypothetical protein
MPHTVARSSGPAAIRAATLAAVLVAASSPAGATVYRWVDEQGQVHYGEIVPPRFRDTARPVDLAAPAPDAAQQRSALERAARDQARAASAAADAGRAPVAPATAGSGSAGPPVHKRPARIPDPGTDCETWQRLYRESQDCFGPYRTVRRGIKPEAFEACNVVPELPSRCRPRLP